MKRKKKERKIVKLKPISFSLSLSLLAAEGAPSTLPSHLRWTAVPFSRNPEPSFPFSLSVLSLPRRHHHRHLKRRNLRTHGTRRFLPPRESRRCSSTNKARKRERINPKNSLII